MKSNMNRKSDIFIIKDNNTLESYSIYLWRTLFILILLQAMQVYSQTVVNYNLGNTIELSQQKGEGFHIIQSNSGPFGVAKYFDVKKETVSNSGLSKIEGLSQLLLLPNGILISQSYFNGYLYLYQNNKVDSIDITGIRGWTNTNMPTQISVVNDSICILNYYNNAYLLNFKQMRIEDLQSTSVKSDSFKIVAKVSLNSIRDQNGDIWQIGKANIYDKGMSALLKRVHLIHKTHRGELVSYFDTFQGEKPECGIYSRVGLMKSFPILQDREKNIWFAVCDGLKKYSYSKKKVELVSLLPNELVTNVFSIIEDNKNTIWIGTNRGLFAYNSNTNSIQRYSTSDGLSDSFIYDIQNTNNGVIWIAHRNGISKLIITSLNQKRIAENNNLFKCLPNNSLQFSQPFTGEVSIFDELGRRVEKTVVRNCSHHFIGNLPQKIYYVQAFSSKTNEIFVNRIIIY